MRLTSWSGVVLVVLASALASARAAAQENTELSAWIALTATPFGAVPSAVTPAMRGLVPGAPPASASELPAGALDFRYGRQKFDGADDAIHAVTGTRRIARFGITAGYRFCDNCDGTLMLAVDYDATLTRQRAAGTQNGWFHVGVQPMAAYGHTFSDDGLEILALGVDVPFSFVLPFGDGNARFVPYVKPGVGFGLLTDGDATESGVRAALGLGVGLMDLAPGLGLTFGWRRVFLENAPSTFGLGFVVGR